MFYKSHKILLFCRTWNCGQCSFWCTVALCYTNLRFTYHSILYRYYANGHKLHSKLISIPYPIMSIFLCGITRGAESFTSN